MLAQRTAWEQSCAGFTVGEHVKCASKKWRKKSEREKRRLWVFRVGGLCREFRVYVSCALLLSIRSDHVRSFWFSVCSTEPTPKTVQLYVSIWCTQIRENYVISGKGGVRLLLIRFMSNNSSHVRTIASNWRRNIEWLIHRNAIMYYTVVVLTVIYFAHKGARKHSFSFSGIPQSRNTPTDGLGVGGCSIGRVAGCWRVGGLWLCVCVFVRCCESDAIFSPRTE